MANVLRRIEIQADSERSWEDAAVQAVEGLRRQLLGNIDAVHAESLSRKLNDGEIATYWVEVTVSLSRRRSALATPGRTAHGGA